MHLSHKLITYSHVSKWFPTQVQSYKFHVFPVSVFLTMNKFCFLFNVDLLELLQPYGFDVGQSERGTVLKGLDLGVQGMRVGGQVRSVSGLKFPYYISELL